MARTALNIVHEFFPKVTEVKDARSSLTIEVTKSDQSRSQRTKHSECALAVACKREQHADGVIVSVGRVYLIKGNVATRYLVPPSISREITTFDRGGDFAPGIYYLSAARAGSRLGERAGAHTSTGTGRAKSLPRHFTADIRQILSPQGYHGAAAEPTHAKGGKKKAA